MAATRNAGMTHAQAVDRVCSGCADAEFGFVAVAATAWHLLGIRAWLQSLRRQGDPRPGMIVCVPLGRFAPALDAHQFSAERDPGQIDILRVRPSRRPLVTTVLRSWLSPDRTHPGRHGSPMTRNGATSGDCPFYLASPRNPFSISPADLFSLSVLSRLPEAVRSRIRLVLLDEGLSSYLRRDNFQATRSRYGADRVGGTVRNRFQRYFRHTAGRLAHLDRLLFQLSPGRSSLRIRPEVAADYRGVLPVISGDAQLRPDDRPLALFAPQPWSARHVDPRADVELRRRLFRRLTDDGYRVLVKPHPRDRRHDLSRLVEGTSAEILAATQPAESIFRVMRADDIVLGYNSTSLLTARSLFGLRSWTVGEALIEAGYTSSWFRSFQGEFRRLSGDLVETADRWTKAA